jgi:hypothetical protein
MIRETSSHENVIPHKGLFFFTFWSGSLNVLSTNNWKLQLHATVFRGIGFSVFVLKARKINKMVVQFVGISTNLRIV